MPSEKLLSLVGRYLPSGLDGLGLPQENELRNLLLESLSNLAEAPLTLTHLNQILHLCQRFGMGEPFFRYYFLEQPSHTYNLQAVLGRLPALNEERVASLDQLEFGIKRFLMDALLYFGDINTAYASLARLDTAHLKAFFADKSFDCEQMKSRGPHLSLEDIPIDDRHLIGEMASAAYTVPSGKTTSSIEDSLLMAYRALPIDKRKEVSIQALINTAPADTQRQLSLGFAEFALNDVLDQRVESENDLHLKVAAVARRYEAARSKALRNTKVYLSLVNELDVYVATSMRTRQHFRDMAHYCSRIFNDPRLKPYHVRYFDPTNSAAEGHEDKGLIECLMVKCALALVYFAGEKESYGKDAEAAMALSQGKPVIIFCNDEAKMKLYRDVHPLTRLIDMNTGVAVGAIITREIEHVPELLHRIFSNSMEYEVVQERGYFRLKERLTGSVVRLQTSSELLRTSFWNYYHAERQ